MYIQNLNLCLLKKKKKTIKPYNFGSSSKHTPYAPPSYITFGICSKSHYKYKINIQVSFMYGIKAPTSIKIILAYRFGSLKVCIRNFKQQRHFFFLVVLFELDNNVKFLNSNISYNMPFFLLLTTLTMYIVT